MNGSSNTFEKAVEAAKQGDFAPEEEVNAFFSQYGQPS